MRTRKFPALIALLVAFAAVTAGGAYGQTAQDTESSTVTAAVTQTNLGGTRVLSSVGAFTLSNVSGTTLSNSFSVTVTETVAQGVSPWYVTVDMADMSDAGTNTIQRENLSLGGCTGSLDLATALSSLAGTSGNNVTMTSLGASSAFPVDDSQDLELLRVSNESSGVYYTNVIACTPTLTLDLPASVADGTYTGQLTVDLIW